MDVKVALADTSAHNYSQLDGQDDGKVVPALYDSGSDVPFTDPPYPFLDGADGAWHESMLAYASESSMRETTSRATVAEGRLRCVERWVMLSLILILILGMAVGGLLFAFSDPG